MATASVTNTFVGSTTISSAGVNTNFSDLVSFLNGDVVHRDGSKAMSGDLDMGGHSITEYFLTIQPSSGKTDVTLSSGAGTYDTICTTGALPRAGSYLIIASGYVESTSLAADVAFTGRIARMSDSTDYGVSRVRQFGAVTGSATHLSPMTIAGIATVSASDQVRFQVTRDATSGTQKIREASIISIPIIV